MLDKIFLGLVKVGMLTFEDSKEGANFYKIAQDAMPPEMQAAMAGMGQGMPPAMPAEAVPPEAMGQQAMPQGPSSAMTAVGEGVTNKDIESLLKIVNILTSMKSEYDAIKKDQLGMLQAQMEMSAPAPQAAEQAPQKEHLSGSTLRNRLSPRSTRLRASFGHVSIHISHWTHLL